VFLITAQRDFLRPSAPFCCCNALLNNSIQQATDLPDPTGPLSPLKKLSDLRKLLSVCPSGL